MKKYFMPIMFNNPIKNKTLNVLITRPTEKAKSLTKALANIDIVCVHQSLFDYQPLADYQTSERLLTNNNILIFVSVSGVQFANKIFSATCWRYKNVIAVGNATKVALQRLGISKVLCPEQENSEGLLALSILNKNFSRDAITIVRGDSGREHLAEQLTKRGATVTYLESYQCVWRTLKEDIAKQWFQQQINCIVVTSNAILEKLNLLVFQQDKNNTEMLINYWRNQCLWVVASQRIANTAQKFGLTHVIISNGASEKAIANTLQQFQNN